MSEFSWEELHKNLDIGMATMITETRRTPSQINLMEFAAFVFNKNKEE